MKAVIGLLAWLALAACASSGVQVSEDQARSFKIGAATYAEVVAALGPPSSSTVSSNGQRTAIYSYAQTQIRPQTFIPYVGGLVAGSDTKTSAAVFVFDSRGILQNMSSSQGQIGSGANLTAR
jgi:hypothetical protein